MLIEKLLFRKRYILFDTNLTRADDFGNKTYDQEGGGLKGYSETV